MFPPTSVLHDLKPQRDTWFSFISPLHCPDCLAVAKIKMKASSSRTASEAAVTRQPSICFKITPSFPAEGRRTCKTPLGLTFLKHAGTEVRRRGNEEKWAGEEMAVIPESLEFHLVWESKFHLGSNSWHLWPAAEARPRLSTARDEQGCADYSE